MVIIPRPPVIIPHPVVIVHDPIVVIPLSGHHHHGVWFIVLVVALALVSPVAAALIADGD